MKCVSESTKLNRYNCICRHLRAGIDGLQSRRPSELFVAHIQSISNKDGSHIITPLSMKEEAARIILPAYTLLKHVRKSSILKSNWYTKVSIGPALIIVFSFMTFVGIRQTRISNTILFTEILYSGYLRVVEKIMATSQTDEQVVFFFFSTKSLLPLKSLLVQHEKNTLVALFAASCIFGYLSVYIMKIGRLLLSILVVLYVRDSGWFKQTLEALNIDLLFFEVAIHLALLIAAFLVMGYVVKFFWAVLLSFVGSMSLTVVLQDTLGVRVEAETLFDESKSWLVVGPGNPAMLFVFSFFLLGMVSQFMILK
eukprot:jgi/Antlo1/181/1120